MDKQTHQSTTDSFEKLASTASQQDLGSGHFHLRLYVAGMTPRSLRAFNVVRNICQGYLADRYELEVIDIYQHPQTAKQDQIIAVPTLVKITPPPRRVLVGDLSDRLRLINELGLGNSSS